jgi:pimeloyl-ACP methyl ester carboxylesterase
MIQFRLFLYAFLCLASPLALAAHQGELVEVDGRKVFVDYVPAESGQPTAVLLNGLTYSTTNWNAFVKELHKRAPGVGLLRFDMIGMGETLLAGKVPVDYAIPYTDQVELTAKLIRQLRLKKCFIVGLSYGGGIAIAFGVSHPELVDQLVLMAPFTEPLQQMDQYIRREVAANRVAFPLNPATDDELYDFFLRQFIYSTYPSFEPVVVENPYKLEGIFRMVQGIRHYETLRDVRKSLSVPTHLMVASQDQYIPTEVHDRFWKAVPRAARASRINISVTEHKIPEAIPAFAAAWTAEILRRRPELQRGLTFEGSTIDSDAKSGSLTIPLK